MITNGVRILDNDNHVVTIKLPDILSEINGNLYKWSILFVNATGDLGEEFSIPTFENLVNNSKDGYFINWIDLNKLSSKFWDVEHIIIIGCKDKALLHRYEEEQEMYETCDIVIQMIDSCYWEVFSKDDSLLERFRTKFKDVVPLKSDFMSSENDERISW